MFRSSCCSWRAPRGPLLTPVRFFGKRKRRQKNLVEGGESQGEDLAPGHWEEVREAFKVKAKELGFSRAGVTTAEPSARLAHYENWIKEGKHGEMGYLGREDRLERRRDLSVIHPGVQAVLCVMLTYWPGRTGFPQAQADPRRGAISCYAWGEDYHTIIGEKLRLLSEWLHGTYGGSGRHYVDTGPLLERDLAQRCGLGFVGKNTLHINEQLGSGHFLAEILTTLPIPPDPPRKKTGGCGKCRKCIVACPTGAIDTNGYSLDARRCISYLTIEHKGSIDPQLRPLMGNLIYGCDICQVVCPWNRFSWPGASSTSPLFGPADQHVSAPELVELLVELKDDDSFRQRFRGSAIERIGRERMVRNVAVALGNAKDPALLPVLRAAAEREAGTSPMVLEHIHWAINQITGEATGQEEEPPPEQQEGEEEQEPSSRESVAGDARS